VSVCFGMFRRVGAGERVLEVLGGLGEGGAEEKMAFGVPLGAGVSSFLRSLRLSSMGKLHAKKLPAKEA